MSAPKTNLEKQKRRHWGPLVGIALALTVATLLFLWLVGNIADTDTPEPVPQPAVEDAGGLPATGEPATPMSPEVTAPPVLESPAPGQD
jgi:hypothetical protein